MHKKTPLSLAAFMGASFLCVLFCASAVAETPVVAIEESVTVSPAAKNVINGGLKFLAGKQHLNGSWYFKEGVGGHPVAMTGYTLIAFMSAGNLPSQGIYKKNVAAGMQFLLDSIQPNGMFRSVSGSQYMYNHGIATVALAELYGETHSATLRPKLERLVKVILKAQNSTGGWRYSATANDADISVTVLQAVALRAAQEAGIAVPQDAIEKAVGYVHSCFNESQGGFSYQPGGGAGFARTAGAIYSLQVLGKYDDPKVQTGSQFLFAHSSERGDFWAYGSCYAAPAQYMIGGPTWRNWYAMMTKALMEKVQHNGDLAFWDDNKEDTGPILNTAVFVTILSMPYHFLPLYQR